MGLRTYGVRTANRAPATMAEEVYNNNIDIGSQVTFPGGEYADNSRGLYPRAQEIPGQSFNQSEIDITGEYGDETIGRISSIAGSPPAGPVMPDAVDTFQTDDISETEKLSKAEKLRMAGAVIESIGGIVNAVAKHQNFVSSNNMRILSAQQQQNYVKADAARAILRQGNAGEDRKDSALLSAIAQGQAPEGDLAQTQMSNEDVYTAQQVMNIEINAMRSVYGLQSEILTMETNNRISRINRNASIAQNIISAGGQIAIGST